LAFFQNIFALPSTTGRAGEKWEPKKPPKKLLGRETIPGLWDQKNGRSWSSASIIFYFLPSSALPPQEFRGRMIEGSIGGGFAMAVT